MIASAQAQTRHIILFSDASDAEQSANYQDIVQKLREANVTVSVVGLGTDHDCDAELLRDIARRGGGECYFSDNPDELPRIFAQDTFTIARSTFIDTATPFSFTAGYSLLGSPPTAAPPSLGGYNLCYLRPQANLAAVTDDEYKAPVVASWNAGNGRVLCYLGEADGKYAGDLARWNQAGEFYATLARWVAGKRQPLPNDMLLTQEVRDGVCFVQLHLDPARQGDAFATLPELHVLHGLAGSAPAKETLSLQWKNADLLEAAVPIAGRETVLNTVKIPGQPAVTMAPACQPYSPEFAPEQPGRGASTLAQIATTTGGRDRVDLSKIWEELPVKPRYVELAPWLLSLAALLFLAEVFDRRTGWLMRRFRRQAAVQNNPADTEKESPATAKREPSKPKKPAVTPQPAPAAIPVAAADPGMDFLRQARERASRRADKK